MKALLCVVVMVALPLVSQAPKDSKAPEAGMRRASSVIPAEGTETPPDYGIVDGRHYVNSHFGFSYRYPEGWTGNVIQSSNTRTTDMYMLFTANPSTTTGADVRYLSVNVDLLPKGATAKGFMEATIRRVAGPTGAFEILHTDKPYTFGGKEFHRLDLVSKPASGSQKLYQTQVFTLFPNFAVTFSFVATDPDDMAELVRSMESLSFTDLSHSATKSVREAHADSQPQPK